MEEQLRQMMTQMQALTSQVQAMARIRGCSAHRRLQQGQQKPEKRV
jgi:hypothetical protein